MTHACTSASPWSEFQTRDPSRIQIFLDRGRADVLFNMINLPELGNGRLLSDFVKAAFVASDGDPSVVELLFDAFDQWFELDEAFRTRVRDSWCRSDMTQQSAIALLRRVITAQTLPAAPVSMIEAMFDDASFDFVAYLKWHNGDD